MIQATLVTLVCSVWLYIYELIWLLVAGAHVLRLKNIITVAMK